MLNNLVDVNVPLGRDAKYGKMLVRVESFAEHIHEHVYTYGLRQILNDAMADKTDDNKQPLPTEQIVAKAQKRLDALYAGDVRVRNGSAAEPIDPVAHEAWRLAVESITISLRKLGFWPKKGSGKFQIALDAYRVSKDAEPIDMAEYIDLWLEAHPKVVALAKRHVAEREKNLDDIIGLV